mmetsp:Transcript_8093/g.11655  ORF Transcript_8093/g.11655 Transcript_8093/m.11655 type:complete len:217 (-) Transcript_8093:283-933(-)
MMSSFKFFLSMGCLLLAANNQNVSAFTPSTKFATTPMTMSLNSMVDNNNDDSTTAGMNRRQVLNKSFMAGVASVLMTSTQPALAKEKEPITRENVASAFADLKFELNDPNGGIAIIQSRIDANDFAGVMDFTKDYDLELRKKRMGRAKKLLTNNAQKEVATMTGNAVTFDLIGINRNSRPGQENAEKANKYLNELRTDLQNMINMEETIDFSLVEL